MPLNKSKGNMYPFIDYTWNPICGECPHECSYCYVERIHRRFKLDAKPPRLVNIYPGVTGAKNRQKLKRIFVGSAMDIFAQDIPGEWIREVLLRCRENGNNFYLFQTKNPARYSEFMDELPAGTFLCTTLESNREYPRIYNLAPSIEKRVSAFRKIKRLKMISIEPILDFDVMAFFEMILSCKPDQVNIGADSGRNGLPEPPKEKILELIEELEKHTKVVQKKNLVRLLK